jgi:hypothetical protein
VELHLTLLIIWFVTEDAISENLEESLWVEGQRRQID